MASNEQIILDRVLEERRAEQAAALDEGQFFNIFATEQALKDLDLSYDETAPGFSLPPDPVV